MLAELENPSDSTAEEALMGEWTAKAAPEEDDAQASVFAG